jgi:hypothetical protein
MITKTLLATATAAAIAAGTLGIAATTAEAGTRVVTGIGGHPYGYRYLPPRPVCKPIYRTVAWYDWKGKKHWTKKIVGNTCHGPGMPHPHPH